MSLARTIFKEDLLPRRLAKTCTKQLNAVPSRSVHTRPEYLASKARSYQSTASAQDSLRLPSPFNRLNQRPRACYGFLKSSRSRPNNIDSVRFLSFIPSSRGPTQVQHVKFTTGEKKWWENAWFQRIVIWIICLRLLGITGRKREDSAPELPQMKSSLDTVTSVSGETKVRAANGSDSSTDEEDVVLEIDSDDAWFLPFGWPQKKAPTRYKGTDDEWKEFQKFSMNKQKKAEVQKSATQLIQVIVDNNPQFLKVLGGPAKPTKYWLDFDYPISYSEGYEVNGFLITEDIVAYAVRDYDEQTIERFYKVISPLPLLEAFWAVTKQAFASKEGFATQMKDSDKIPISIPGIPDLTNTPDLAKVVGRSMSKLRRRTAPTSVPRGSIVISGRIDIAGSRSWASFNFLGFYDPKEDGWRGMPSISLGAVRPLKLSPKG